MGYFLETVVEHLAERFPFVVAAVLVFAGVRRLLIRRGALRRRAVFHEAAVAVFAGYAAVVLSLTFLPLPFWRFLFSPSPGMYNFDSNLLAMLRGEYTTGEWGMTMFIANVLIFVPLGFLMPVLWRQTWRQTLLIALSATLCIELIQPFFARSFDIDDILLNFIGSAIGLLFSAIPRVLCPKLVSKIRE